MKQKKTHIKPAHWRQTLAIALLSACFPQFGNSAETTAATKPPEHQEASGSGFDKTLELQGVSFHITSPNNGSINKLRIEPKGLKAGDEAIEREIEGTINDAEVADLNVDGSPELYIYVTSAGSGSYGSLVAYAVNKGKSMSEIFLPPIQDDPKAARGYQGHDEFRVVENSLVRRFPVYRKKDTNAKPTGGTRQLDYRLKAGEAGWVLRYKRIENY